MNYPIYIFFGLAPSIIWLLFYLRKDSHPESNRMILKVFFFGMLAALPTALIEIGFAQTFQQINLPKIVFLIFYVFVGIALMEELAKYLVVKKAVLKNSALDEPVDLMLYMIISALGFAALENLFVLFPLLNPFQLLETAMVSVMRFVGATFLHGLVSGLVGYFLVLSYLKPSKRWQLTILGLLTAAGLHGLYNFSIIKIDGNFKFIMPIFILISLTIFVSLGFKKVKKLKSICKIT